MEYLLLLYTDEDPPNAHPAPHSGDDLLERTGRHVEATGPLRRALVRTAANRSLRALACVLALVSPGALLAQTPAFPGAVGFGASATGGRGGDVYHVVQLEDSGVGSLRDGIESATGPRTIVFEVGGTIELSRPLVIDKSALTIAGQTAPGGVGTRGYPVHVSGTSDIVIRFMRFRTGDINAQAVFEKPARGNGDLSGDAGDALSVGDSQRVIVDHVSASWGMDETLSVTLSADVTLQHCIISEGLDDSYHSEGRHGYGSLIRGTGVGGISIVGNLYAHQTWRSPAVGGLQNPAEGEPRAGLDVEVVNNVIYDWEVFPSHTVEGLGTTKLEFLGNVSIAGPDTLELCVDCSFFTLVFDVLEGDELLIHQSGNLIDSDREGTHDPVPATIANFVGEPYTETFAPFGFARPEFEILDAASAYDRVIEQAGASLSRDAIDARILQELAARSGGIIDSQDDVGGWPDPPVPLPAPEDADRDGMADSWEEEHGLDPSDPEDRNRNDLDGDFTNLEVYLDDLTMPVPEPGSEVSWWMVAALLVWSRRPRTSASPSCWSASHRTHLRPPGRAGRSLRARCAWAGISSIRTKSSS